MHSEQRAGIPLTLAAIGGLLFLHIPLMLIVLYAFTTEEKSFQFPPPGYTTHWLSVAWYERPDIWNPMYLSLKVALIATAIALVFGTLAAAGLSRARFFGKESISLLFILPIALPASSPNRAALGLRHHGSAILDPGPSSSVTPPSASSSFTTMP